ncbi:hypothetical protein GLAREA_02090 [Glarea lozoyensis ATCC 20868]|uniref:Uncharacterized protein n=1 Tax=Glarea lozoyensis (strain ATCC 20868 / MF5171) TaxID=1116229 RepID=S3DHX7_GLAL2|nr:uncharacterized protein GLAREA_02090 [Glarea lozoyensis ATCC 20868]EPE26178.1 hypothetical protein GLAREA_02090 [Glarea lozoyensis ATCC 20868]
MIGMPKLYCFTSFLATLCVLFALPAIINAEDCVYAFNSLTGKTQRIQPPFPGVGAALSNGMYTYEAATGVFKPLSSQDILTSQSPNHKRSNIDVGIDFSPTVSVCGETSHDRTLVYAKLGGVLLYLCNFERREVSWADVKEQVGRLNAQCVHGQSGFTAWLPLPTPFISLAACSSQIYQAGNDHELIAFDPAFTTRVILSGIQCLPLEVSASWGGKNPETTTVLGPSFVCPTAYSGVQTILVNELTTQTLCCPSKYQLATGLTTFASFPSQCSSSLTPGETIVYQTLGADGGFAATTSTIAASSGPSFVWGFHVNGFNVANSTSISTTNQQTALSQTPATTSTSNSLSTSTAPSATSINNDRKTIVLSAGAIAGLVVGILVLLASVILGIWIFRRRRRISRNLRPPKHTVPVMADKLVRHDLKADGNIDVQRNTGEDSGPGAISELPQPESQMRIHEMR